MYNNPKLDAEVINNVVSTLTNGKLFRYDCSNPEESQTALLEKEFAEIMGFKYAIAVNSCSSAIFLSLITAGVKNGDEVLIPAFTFIAVPSAVIHAGAIPKLVEISDNFVIDTDNLEYILKQENSPKFLLLSHMRGHIPNMSNVKNICDKYGVILLEDCAHSIGVEWESTMSGKFGLSSSFSMQSYKLLDGGEGGIFATNDEDIAIRAMLYAGCYETNWKKHFLNESSYIKVANLVNTLPAYNFRMSNLTASVVRPQLKYIKERIEIYNSIHSILSEELEKSDKIFVPKHEDGVRKAADSIQFRVSKLSDEKLHELTKNMMEKHGISMQVFGISEHNARCFWKWRFLNGNGNGMNSYPKTKEILRNTCDMRLDLNITPEKIKVLGEKIRNEVETLTSIN